MDEASKQEEPSSSLDDAASDSSSSNNDQDVPVARSFTMAHALSMVRKRNQQNQQAKQEQERLLEQERKEKAREKARRRRQNQKLAKAKQKEEKQAKSKSNPLENPTAGDITSNDATDTPATEGKDTDTGVKGEAQNGASVAMTVDKEAGGEGVVLDATSKITNTVESGPTKGSLKRPNPFIPRALLLKKRQTR